MTTSAWRAISTAADCRSLVGLQTVSMRRTSDCGNRRRIKFDQVPHLLYCLRRLGRHAEAWVLLERKDVCVIEHDVEAIEIAGEAAHLHMVALPDDDDVVAVAREGCDGAVRDVYERARGFDHRQPQGASPREGPLGRAVGRHHQGRRRDVCDVLGDRDALASRAPRTVGLWTRSPRIVRGPASACSSASVMASRTPKHMPRWTARRMRIFYNAKRSYTKNFM